MRRANADYAAVERALTEYQRQTIRDYARACGLAEEDVWSDPLCCAMGIRLAVDNEVEDAQYEGATERQALLRAAVRLDLDFESVLRQRRRSRRKADVA